MKVLNASYKPHLPQAFGGSQSSIHDLSNALIGAGAEVACLAGLAGNGWTGLKHRIGLKLSPGTWTSDMACGYRTFRAWFPDQNIHEVIEQFAPDIALVHAGYPVIMAKALMASGVPVAVYLRDADETYLGGDPRDLGTCAFLANSQFTADFYRSQFGISSTVVYPLIDASQYATETTGEAVLFINPHENKGVAIAAGIARHCPDIPFIFQRGWSLDDEQETAFQALIDGLGNVTVRPQTSDMKPVYAAARFVLAPSMWEEAFGRVAAEAHASGIPVIASDRGGLPEAVGAGGLLVPGAAPVSDWVDAVRSLWADDTLHARLSAAAHDHAGRPEMDNARQVAAIMSVLTETITAPSNRVA